MSLYLDDDVAVGLQPEIEQKPSVPSDPLQALAAALSLPAESSAQAEALVSAGTRFEEHPERLPELCGQLLPMVVEGGESLLRSWTLDMVALAVGRSGLQVDVKLNVAQSSLDALNRLLNGRSIPTIKAVIPIFSTIYPIIFKLLATTRPPQAIYDVFLSSKARILSLALDPATQPQNIGVKACSWKYIQQVLLAGTKAAGVDPRLQTPTKAEANISMINRDSPMNASELEQEANLLKTQLVTQMYSSDNPAILHPLFNTLPTLCKKRPALAPLFVSSLTSWTPAALDASKKPGMQIRAVERTLRMVMIHISRHSTLAAFSAQLTDALIRQKQRIEVAMIADAELRQARRDIIPSPVYATDDSVLGKHPMEAETSAAGAKRARIDVLPGTGDRPGPVFDVSILPTETVIDIVMAGLEAVSTELMKVAFENARRAIADESPDAMYVLGPSLEIIKEDEDEEILNPLDMEMDDEVLELQIEPEVEEEPVTFKSFSLPPPTPLDPADKVTIVDEAIQRIWQNGTGMSSGTSDQRISEGVKLAVQPNEMWMLLLARLGTRGGEDKRRMIGEFVSGDFVTRSKFATIWLNEEWYNEKIGLGGQYKSCLDTVLSSYLSNLDTKDKSLSSFLSALPEIPESTLETLSTLCEDSDKLITGLLTLRDLVEHRPPIRPQALRTLLELCTHSDRKIRVMAINTVKRWVPESPMASAVTDFALGVLRRLISTEIKINDEDIEMEDGDHGHGHSISTKWLTDINPDTVGQHVELLFALSRRSQDLLDEIFQIYPKLPTDLQEPLETLLTPLIQSLGASSKLLQLLRTFPPGSDKLALKILRILSEEGSAKVIGGLVKGLMKEREDLDPRFVIPIIGTLDKAEIESQLPKIVGLLGSGPGIGAADGNRDLVRTAFGAVLQKVTPVELMVLLHQGETETGLKSTIEAIGICFSLTAIFRSDTLQTSLSQILDLPSLPVLFLRTVIQAVSTYKSLIPFIANHVLPKLITKKVWEIPQVWDGFVRLARMISTASFGALMQLPKDVLRDLIERQPGIKTGLKSFLAGKQGSRAAIVEIFGEDA